jgi:hypothetical protein
VGGASAPPTVRDVWYLRQPLCCHPESEAKDLPSIRASGRLFVISSLESPFMVRPRQDRTDGLGCGNSTFILNYSGDPPPRLRMTIACGCA